MPFTSFMGVEFMKIVVSWIFTLLVNSYVVVDHIFPATKWIIAKPLKYLGNILLRIIGFFFSKVFRGTT